MRVRAARQPLLAGLSLLGLTLLFWKLRIIDLGAMEAFDVGSMDLYTAHLPMTRYGFGALRAGELPLWNPYQFCGEPFLATYYTGLFYPLNLLYLFLDVPAGTEVSLILHMMLGGLGMWCLARRFGIGTLGALCAAVTFLWSGWMVAMTNQATGFSAESWMPLTVLLLDRTAQGEKRAWLWLTLAVTSQLLIGAIEIFIHSLYAGGLLTAFRLVKLVREGAGPAALKGACRVVACLAGGLLLSAAQLLPTLELVQISLRAPGELTLKDALYMTQVLSPLQFLRGSLSFTGRFAVGVLPVVGVAFALGFRKHRLLWIFGAVLTGIAAALASGGPAYRLYHALPLGDLFRRPEKFIDLYAFGQALLAGVAISRLESWATWSRARLWTHPAWLVGLVLGGAASLWLLSEGALSVPLIALMALLLASGAASRPGPRRLAIAALCLVHAATLFFGNGNLRMRPISRAEGFWTQRSDLLEAVEKRAGHQRVYISPALWFVPGLSIKQGMLNEIHVVDDYEPIVARRYGEFFDRLSADPSRKGVFNGRFRLLPRSRWQLLDLTGTEYFVMRSDEDAALYMTWRAAAARDAEFDLIADGEIQIFRQREVLPRAYFVSRARVVRDPEELLEALNDPGFDPRNEVLLEEEIEALAAQAADAPPAGRVEIERDDPERVVLAVEAERAGFLVLSDLDYRGWKAFADRQELPILRANYLFRAVKLEPGRHRVRFEYRPASFRLGLALSLSAALAIAAIGAAAARTRREQPTA